MKTSKALNYLYMGASATALLLSCYSSANAQTVTVDADVTVQNTLTLTVVDNLDFGTIVAIADTATGKVADMPIDASTDTLGPATTTGAPAYMAIVDSTNAQGAQITVEDGADGANINVTINNVINPTFGGASFTLTNWESSYNGGATGARTAATPFVVVFSSAFALGVNTLDIGASLRTGSVAYTDGAYDGGFDVVFSY